MSVTAKVNNMKFIYDKRRRRWIKNNLLNRIILNVRNYMFPDHEYIRVKFEKPKKNIKTKKKK